MDRVRCRNKLRPPEGWDKIKDMVLDLNQQMRMAEVSNVISASPQEQLWAVMRCNWQRSRPIYQMRWKDKTISEELYDWILKQGYADRDLINAWRRPGYERLCCVACISKNTDHGGTCICRVPKKQRNPGVKCFNCGCTGCCSGDFSDDEDDQAKKEEKTE